MAAVWRNSVWKYEGTEGKFWRLVLGETARSRCRSSRASRRSHGALALVPQPSLQPRAKLYTPRTLGNSWPLRVDGRVSVSRLGMIPAERMEPFSRRCSVLSVASDLQRE